MKILILFCIIFCFVQIAVSQKKQLDHLVYDSWQSIGERMISNDGKWVVYTINVQEGDNELVIQSADANYMKKIERGFNALITEDSRYVVFRIRPYFKETREAKIKKKKPDEMPKDSFAIVELGKDAVHKIHMVKTYKTPEKASGWVAYHIEKKTEPEKPRTPLTDVVNKKVVDSLKKTIDSLIRIVNQPTSEPAKKKRKWKDDEGIAEIETIYDKYDADGDEGTSSTTPEGTDLVLRNLLTGEEKKYPFISEYYFDKSGKKLLLEATKNSKDSLSKPSIVLIDLLRHISDTICKGGNDFKNFVFSDDGTQLAFLAEREAKSKELQKFYKLWYHKEGMDTASLLVDKNSPGMKIGMTVSEFGNLSFSKSGRRLFFGAAPVQPLKDTTLIEIDQVKLDIWHYNDDYLQTAQLFRLQRDLQENFLAVYDLEKNTIKQLGSKEIPIVYQINEGDAATFVGVTDFGKRVESQWTGNTLKDVYAINVADGSKKLVVKDMKGVIAPQYISPTGKYIMWYDRGARNYFVWDGDKARNITAKINVPLWNEEYDSPDDPPPYGVMGWHEGDSAVYVYDKYDMWKVDPLSKFSALTIFGGRKQQIIRRFISTDPDERTIKSNRPLVIRVLNDITKNSGLEKYDLLNFPTIPYIFNEAVSFSNPIKAKNSEEIILTEESFIKPPDLFVVYPAKPVINETTEIINRFVLTAIPLSSLNLQQKDYNWGTAELFKWKAYTGKEVEGVLYKPEDFDPKKKYPMICYFYETHSDGLNSYIPPSPTPSRLSISFFVSRGYVVFSPDIHYGTGHPARDCYNHVVSGARALVKNGFIDSTRIGIQGQSWGGIQVAQLITMTNLFSAAWAGAPVANMTSAYGGIRWESGVNRQFQYEKSQSRIGATLWEKPELYIENSPLFHLPKVKTPLVIMANDNDGAVPWYQGIELFTSMRRLGKKVWMLNYNGEAHNLVERKNRKDISIREQQYFDWLLKGEKPPKWITEGVPAVMKGKDWGLELVN